MTPGGTQHTIRLELMAVHREVRVARNVLRRFARMEGLADQGIEVLELVLSELLANAIDHGGGGSALTEEELAEDVRRRLSFSMTGSTWQLAVTDQGGGDPDEVRALFETSMPDLEDDRGRGLFLMREMVDRIEVSSSDDGRGLTVSVTKSHGGG